MYIYVYMYIYMYIYIYIHVIHNNSKTHKFKCYKLVVRGVFLYWKLVRA